MDVKDSGEDDLKKTPPTCCQKLKSCITLTPEGATPINYKVMALCILALFSSSLTITFLFPFLPEMILSFGYAEEEKGYYAGIVASAMFAGRAFGSYFWGWLSDKKGRRPILIITIIGNGIFSLAFGFSRNLTQAIAFRFLTGLSNGSVGTAKTVLYEISDNSNQAVGMTTLSLAWGGGIILGPAIGGYFASPAKKYSSVFDPSGFFGHYPYILPSIIVFSVAVFAVVILFWKMPETLKTKLKQSEEVEVTEDLIGPGVEVKVIDSTRELEKADDSSCRNTDFRRFLSLESVNCDTRLVPYMSSETARDPVSHLREGADKQTPILDQQLYCTSRCRKDDTWDCHQLAHQQPSASSGLRDNEKEGSSHCRRSLQEEAATPPEPPHSCCARVGRAIMNSSIVSLLGERDVRHAVFLYTFFSFAVIGYEDVFTIWASTEPIFDGLGFTTDQIGTAIGTASIPLLCLQIFFFPFMSRRMGLIKSFWICGSVTMIVVLATPMLHLIYDQPASLWTGLLLSQMPMKMAVNCCFAATSLFINNSVGPEIVGSVNGIAMTATAIARTMAPTIGGSVFAWSISYGTFHIGAPFDVYLSFLMFSVVFWLSTIYSIFTPECLNRQSKK
ncbi:uncharacterized protein LOC135476450 [Liolophura sinensis]|uniref:uncharacterized protein LOC135476450 n=1 Tax=Liolophura sinensis TaxID=3198878 RepID=UPI003157F267